MNDTQITCRIHRHGDRVAIALHDGQTIYLNPADVSKLADALVSCALNCVYTPFAQSAFGSRSFEFAGKV